MNQENLQLFFSKPLIDGLVFTANQRQARFLQQCYKQYQQNLQNLTWASLPITTLDHWLLKQFSELQLQGLTGESRIITTAATLLIWQQIITQEQLIFLNVESTARLAYEAWERLQHWQLDLSTQASFLNDDQQLFMSWTKKFVAHCANQHLLTPPQLIAYLTPFFQNQILTLPMTIYCYGFDDYSPAVANFLTLLRELGTVIETIAFPNTSADLQLYRARSSEQELLAMAQWVHEQYTLDPEVSIACVLPNLQTRWQEIKRVFEAQFESPYPFNLSAGLPLVQTPLVYSGLSVLALKQAEFSTAILLEVLHSPFLQEANIELFHRAQLANYLQQQQLTDWTLDLIIELLDALPTEFIRPQIFISLLKALQAFNLPATATLDQWVSYFNKIHQIMGWPGDRTLSSAEYQAYTHWQTLLVDFNSLDASVTSVRYSQALSYLKTLAQQQIFQIKTPTTRIQILGTLEAAGLAFDYIWLAECSLENWPPRANPNPFIPFNLQRDYQMPHATADRELAFCQLLTQHYQSSCHTMMVSYAQMIAGEPQEISPLFRGCTAENMLEPNELVKSALALDVVADQYGIALANDTTLAGGTGIFKSQALCPFQGYAKYRLDLRPSNSDEPIFNLQTHGSLLHNALQIIFTTIRNHADLIALLHTDPSIVVAGAVQQSCRRFFRKRKFFYQQRQFRAMLALEQQRLQQQILKWLAVEAERPSFTVLACEQALMLTLDDINIAISIDRIDELADCSQLIIDYKTGLCDIADWFGERPHAPQLPLYALAYEFADINALAYAKISAKEYGFVGLSQNDVAITGIELFADSKFAMADQSWPELLAEWRVVFSKLSQEIKTGFAKVAPYDLDQTCRQCGLQSVCRIKSY